MTKKVIRKITIGEAAKLLGKSKDEILLVCRDLGINLAVRSPKSFTKSEVDEIRKKIGKK